MGLSSVLEQKTAFVSYVLKQKSMVVSSVLEQKTVFVSYVLKQFAIF